MNFTDILTVSITAIIISAVALWLKDRKPELALIFAVCGAIATVFYIVRRSTAVFGFFTELTSSVGGNEITVALKLTIIAIVIETASDICRDAGQKSLSSKVELAGRFAMVAVSMPLYKTVIELIMKYTE